MEQFLQDNSWIGVLIAVWSLPWKAWALWKAVKNDSKPWFIALMLIHTIGILDILYIYVFSKKKATPPQQPTA